MQLNIGLQLYTVRDEFKLGMDAVYAKIKEAGYSAVELIYLPDKTDELYAAAKKYALPSQSTHIGLSELENNYERALKFLKTNGVIKAIIPSLPGDLFESVETVKQVCERMEICAAKIKNDGFELGFHNHQIEFSKKFGDKCIIDLFYEYAPSLKFELDMGWAYAAGADVIGYINKLGSRLSVVHIKDVDENKKPVEVGSGQVDMSAAIIAAAANGVEWGIVEQDNCVKYPPFESIKISYDYLKTINI